MVTRRTNTSKRMKKMEINEVVTQIDSIKNQIRELRNNILDSNDICTFENGSCASYITSELDEAFKHLNNIW